MPNPVPDSVSKTIPSKAPAVSTSAGLIKLRVRVIGFPVKPVVFDRRYFRELLTSEIAANRRPGEIPCAASLGIDDLIGTRLDEKFQNAAVDLAVKRADRLSVIGENNNNVS